jgi:hypothetical protein
MDVALGEFQTFFKDGQVPTSEGSQLNWDVLPHGDGEHEQKFQIPYFASMFANKNDVAGMEIPAYFQNVAKECRNIDERPISLCESSFDPIFLLGTFSPHPC